jgi:predicted nucleic acid-binding protein
MLYLDANVFIYAAINTEEIGKKARTLLQKIQQGDEQAVTNHLGRKIQDDNRFEAS